MVRNLKKFYCKDRSFGHYFLFSIIFSNQKTRLRVKSKTAGRLFQNWIKTMSRPCFSSSCLSRLCLSRPCSETMFIKTIAMWSNLIQFNPIWSNPWNFIEKILRNGRVENLSFFWISHYDRIANNTCLNICNTV